MMSRGRKGNLGVEEGKKVENYGKEWQQEKERSNSEKKRVGEE